MICNSCGKEISFDSNYCEFCGNKISNSDTSTNVSETNTQLESPVNLVIPVSNIPKDKDLAIVLAIFLGIFAWVYTYKKDNGKFWIGFSIFIVGLFTLKILIGFLIIFGLYVWAFIDITKKTQEWYKNYPNC